MKSGQNEELLATLEARFRKNMKRHAGLDWDAIRARLEAQPEKLWSLARMEHSGGEPDVVAYDEQSDQFVFFDCSAESPSGRRSLCYDRAGLESRKEHRPDNAAVDLAEAMGVEILTEDQYRYLQTLGKFDAKTSSWLNTPPEVRKLGGAIFGDFRFGRVFVYHNGAQSYYGGRGFRAMLRA